MKSEIENLVGKEVYIQTIEGNWIGGKLNKIGNEWLKITQELESYVRENRKIVTTTKQKEQFVRIDKIVTIGEK